MTTVYNYNLTSAEFALQDGVFRFTHQKLIPNTILPWVSEFLMSICAPDAATMKIANCKDFAFQRGQVVSRFNAVAAENTKASLAYAKQCARNELAARVKGKKSHETLKTEKLDDVTKILNALMVHFSCYVLKQWQLAAMNVLFFAIVEREVIADAQITNVEAQQFDGFYTTESGYSKAYSLTECFQLNTIGERVAYKVRNAQFGRLMVWASQLHKELSLLVANQYVTTEVLFAPIYAHMAHIEKDNVPAVLEYFMRVMYCSISKDIILMKNRRLQHLGFENSDSTAVEVSDIANYFNLVSALAQQQRELVRRTLQNNDDDNANIDRDEILDTYNRNSIEKLASGPFSCILEDLCNAKQLHSSVSSDDFTSRESFRCVWLVILENAERVFCEIYNTEHSTAFQDVSSLDPALLRIQILHQAITINKLLTSLPPPATLVLIFGAFERFIMRQHEQLLRKYGFDLDHFGTLARCRKHIYDLIAVFFLHDSLILKK